MKQKPMISCIGLSVLLACGTAQACVSDSDAQVTFSNQSGDAMSVLIMGDYQGQPQYITPDGAGQYSGLKGSNQAIKTQAEFTIPANSSAIKICVPMDFSHARAYFSQDGDKLVDQGVHFNADKSIAAPDMNTAQFVYDKFEFTGDFFNLTAVDFFGIPLTITDDTDSSNVTGIPYSRDIVLQRFNEQFSADPGLSGEWQKLMMTNDSNGTVLRVMSPAKSSVFADKYFASKKFVVNGQAVDLSDYNVAQLVGSSSDPVKQTLSAAYDVGFLATLAPGASIDTALLLADKSKYYRVDASSSLGADVPNYDLYAKAIHSFGTDLYAFAYDDLLGQDHSVESKSVTVTFQPFTAGDELMPIDPYAVVLSDDGKVVSVALPSASPAGIEATGVTIYSSADDTQGTAMQCEAGQCTASIADISTAGLMPYPDETYHLSFQTTSEAVNTDQPKLLAKIPASDATLQKYGAFDLALPPGYSIANATDNSYQMSADGGAVMLPLDSTVSLAYVHDDNHLTCHVHASRIDGTLSIAPDGGDACGEPGTETGGGLSFGAVMG
jgi:hypothetical protein